MKEINTEEGGLMIKVNNQYTHDLISKQASLGKESEVNIENGERII